MPAPSPHAVCPLSSFPPLSYFVSQLVYSVSELPLTSPRPSATSVSSLIYLPSLRQMSHHAVVRLGGGPVPTPWHPSFHAGFWPTLRFWVPPPVPRQNPIDVHFSALPLTTFLPSGIGILSFFDTDPLLMWLPFFPFPWVQISLALRPTLPSQPPLRPMSTVFVFFPFPVPAPPRFILCHYVFFFRTAVIPRRAPILLYRGVLTGPNSEVECSI